MNKMILGNLHFKEQCHVLSPKLQECLQYAHTHALGEFEPGSYPIHGEDLYVNIVSYETTEIKNRFWEAHRAYLDLHLLLDGEEVIDLNFIDNMECRPYVPQEDFVAAAGVKKASVTLNIGDFLVCYPEDVHMTGLYDTHPQTIKKAIFKIKI